KLKSGEVDFQGKKIKSTPLSSYSGAREIAATLKDWISQGKFLIGQPSELLPSQSSK
ncbi:MAG: homocysteine biosynthesis protein, partial [Clostridiales bacterium]